MRPLLSLIGALGLLSTAACSALTTTAEQTPAPPSMAQQASARDPAAPTPATSPVDLSGLPRDRPGDLVIAVQRVRGALRERWQFAGGQGLYEKNYEGATASVEFATERWEIDQLYSELKQSEFVPDARPGELGSEEGGMQLGWRGQAFALAGTGPMVRSITAVGERALTRYRVSLLMEFDPSLGQDQVTIRLDGHVVFEGPPPPPNGGLSLVVLDRVPGSYRLEIEAGAGRLSEQLELSALLGRRLSRGPAGLVLGPGTGG